MTRFLPILLLTLPAPAAPPKPLVEGLKNPTSVTVGSDGRIYVSELGEPGKAGNGRILVIKDGKAVPFTTGLDEPMGIVAFQGWLFVADKTRVWRIGKDGKATVFAAAKAFPTEPQSLRDIVVDVESGTLYVADSGVFPREGAIYRITLDGKVSLVLAGKDRKTDPGRGFVCGRLAMDGQSHLLFLKDFGTLHRLKLADGSTEELADRLDFADGLAWDKFGRLYMSEGSSKVRGDKVFVIPRPGDKPVLLAEGFKVPTGICLAPDGKHLIVPEWKAGTLTMISTQVPGQEVDDSPLPLEPAVAFPDLKWTGWKPVDDAGRPTPLRPLVLTHAGDGSNRVFVATQHGAIHVFPDDQKAKATKVFLDIQKKVFYSDNENEQGFLGMAFHPQFKKNGEFFVFYTDRKKKEQNVLSRFRVSKGDPDKADPDSEEELMRIQRPFWNHDGGTICFGPDGYLYIALGDGGSADDPHENGQNLKTILGKVLRIDVDHRDAGLKYAVPKDNPFVGKKDARPEIWCHGLRNIWRMSFDRKTGKLWAADVGQNLYEEINLIEKGGNYGWNLREGLHPFGAKGVGPRKDLIEPIWEYHHDVGKSITGGHVYRGKRLPELEGHYVYGDYVTGRLWALKYDEEKKRVVANRPIKDLTHAVMSFGEDEKGELYYLIASATGQGIYRLVPSAGK
jgi:glucose/arabinose dehydrogenase